MGKKLFVGNLGYGVSARDLMRMFEPHGIVKSAQIIMDRDTGQSKGCGFVEMKTEQEALTAITALCGQFAGGRSLIVNAASWPEPFPWRRARRSPRVRGARKRQTEPAVPRIPGSWKSLK